MDTAKAVFGASPAVTPGGPGSPHAHSEAACLACAPSSVRSLPTPLIYFLGGECWGTSPVPPWGRKAQSQTTVVLMGAENSPTGR